MIVTRREFALGVSALALTAAIAGFPNVGPAAAQSMAELMTPARSARWRWATRRRR